MARCKQRNFRHVNRATSKSTFKRQRMMLNVDELVKQKNINLSGKCLNDDNLDDLIKVIEESTVLEYLDLSSNMLTLSNGKLANVIAKNTTLKVLHLSFNNIILYGIKLLTAALKESNTIEILNLDGNDIGDEGAEYIADMLAVNKSLQEINLNYNNIGDKGAESIAASLYYPNSAIHTMLLFINKIGDKGAEKFADALEGNHNIKTLLLYGNNIMSKDVMDRIKTKLQDKKESDTVKKDEQIEMNPNTEDDTPITKDEEIAMLRNKNKALEKAITAKDEEIASLKESLKNSKPIDLVDLTDTTSSKRPRTENTSKSALAIQHEQSKKIVQVKEEKIAVEAALEDVKEDLEDNQEDMGRQVLFTDFLQSKIDELAALAEAGGADRARVAEIKGRSYSSMSS